jgi:cell division protein FtsB
MPVQLPTLTGVVPEPAERALRTIAAAVDSLEAQVKRLSQPVADAQTAANAAAIRELTTRVDILTRQVKGLLEA